MAGRNKELDSPGLPQDAELSVAQSTSDANGVQSAGGLSREVSVHKSAIVESGAIIGPGTRVDALTHILAGAVIGGHCLVGDHVYIENRVQIGDQVTIMPGVQVWSSIVLEDDVFIGPNVTFANRPPSENSNSDRSVGTTVRKGASIGANATIAIDIVIGRNAVVEAGSVVTSNVPAYAIVTGNPARITGYVSSSPLPPLEVARHVALPEGVQVGGVQMYNLPVFIDLRGNLSVAEFEGNLPFIPKRYFVVFDVPNEQVRGEHAHKTLRQFLVCVKGSCAIVVDDGTDREEFLLNRPNLGLYIPPMVWATQYKYSQDGVLLVFASDKYDPADYIRDYDEYIEAVKER